MGCNVAISLKRNLSTLAESEMHDDPEIAALTSVYVALKDLDGNAQQRVIDYVSKKLGLVEADTTETYTIPRVSGAASATSDSPSDSRTVIPDDDELGDSEGISPIALKWMRRNGLNVSHLGKLFSLGADEIDLVAKSVPGNSRNARTRSVVLLKGIAAYLSTGAARMTSEQIKEVCLHYDAFDAPNHAKYLKGIAAELGGDKSTGYVLTARGLTAGTELIKSILGVDAS